MNAGTYKISGVVVTLNSYGCVMQCNDWETIYPREDASPEKLRREPHWGTNADLFRRGMGGHYFAKPEFFDEARKLD